MITIDRLEKRFGERRILAGVTVAFGRGEVTSLVGPSGAGKSTLLRCINGLESFDGGSITAFGTPVRRETLPVVRAKVGMVFQHFGLFAHMTAIANVMEAPVHLRREATAEARDRARALLDKVGLSHRTDAYPRELSGGEQQRVAIARALAMRPEALLLDEPTSALDRDRKQEVIAVLAKLAEEGTTMVLVTHDSALAAHISRRVVRLDGGAIVADGSPRDVLAG